MVEKKPKDELDESDRWNSRDLKVTSYGWWPSIATFPISIKPRLKLGTCDHKVWKTALPVCSAVLKVK